MIRNMGSSRDAIEPTVLLVGAGERFTPAFQAALARYRVQVETTELASVTDAVIVTAPDLVLLMGDAAKDGGAVVLQKLAGLSQNFSVPVVVPGMASAVTSHVFGYSVARPSSKMPIPFRLARTTAV